MRRPLSDRCAGFCDHGRRGPLGKAVFLVAALVLGLPASSIASAQSGITLLAGGNYAAHVTAAARRFAIPEAWIWQVMRTESGGKARAVSAKGAMGLMQLMPGTWATLSARYGLGDDPFDTAANIQAGAAYLREMWDRYGDLSTALAAYNAGPGRADAWRRTGRPLPAETIAYVARIAPALGAPVPDLGSAVPATGGASSPSWRASGLFVNQTAAAPASAHTAREADLGLAARPSGATPERVGFAGASAGGLFVARSGSD